MNYEEKRELRLQISQLLADAGLNQGAIKQMVEEEIRSKVDKAIDQTLSHLNAQSGSNNYIQERITKYLNDNYMNSYAFTSAMKDILKDRVVQIVLKDCETGGQDAK